MRNELQVAVKYLEHQLELVRCYAEGYPDKDNYTAIADIYTTALDTTLSALRDALKRGEGCDTCMKGKAHFGDVLWAINRNGKAVININGEQANTVFHHCPMCGRQLDVSETERVEEEME